MLLSVLSLDLVRPLPTRVFELYSQMTEKLWERRGTLRAVNAHSACEAWLGSIKGGSKVMDATYNVAVIPAGDAPAPGQLNEETVFTRAFYLYCGYIRGRLPQHLRWLIRRRKR